MKHRKVILFGLDGATFSVLDDLRRRGVMPFLSRFMDQGVRGTLVSTIPPLTPPAWTTLVTGRSPGAHGIFNFLQFDGPSSPYLRIMSSRDVRCETIWSMAGRQGCRAASLNFVGHGPAPRINGIVIPGWVPWRWLKKYSHPAGLIERLRSEIPGLDLQELAMNFKEEEKAVAGAGLENYDDWIDVHIRRERQWFNLLLHLLETEDCRLLGIVFDGVDKLQHLLWRYLDPELEPADPCESFLRTREHCWDYFRLIDQFLGRTVAAAGDDALVLIVSDHGFCASSEIVYINTWLEQQGFLAWTERAQVEPDSSQELGEAHPYHLTHLDMARTRAFATSASSNGIHIAVAGVRGDHGIPAGRYESFRNDLKRTLLTRCNDPATGEALITDVWTREEIFAGPHMTAAPDLTVGLRGGGFFSVLRSNRVVKNRSTVMGSHHPEGVLIARGRGVRRGGRLNPVTLVDIAPTVLHALGLAIPRELEGRVIEDLFEDEFRAVGRFEDEGSAVQAEAPFGDAPEAMDDESESQLLMRLKALGYIE